MWRQGDRRVAASEPCGERVAVVLGPLDPIVACGLESLLSRDPQLEVLPVPSASLDSLIDERSAHIVVTDENADRAALLRLRAARPEVGLLVLADEPSLADVVLLAGMGVGCVGLGASLVDIHRVVRLIARERGRSAHGDGLSRLPLTMREIDVLEGILAGHTHARIAAALNIGVRTVGTHVSQIHRKLGIRRSRELFISRSLAGWDRRDRQQHTPMDPNFHT